MIRVESSQAAYNPIREHIRIKFETCPNNEERLVRAAQLLAELRPEISRAIIFVRTRRMAEDISAGLGEKLPGALNGKTGFFHAGLNADERDEAYEAFRSGKSLVLVATKAFGMGMDIPNIHAVLHLGPSSTFEDFLQEIGRAGRDAAYLVQAGLSSQKPIETYCLLIPEDFEKLKDLLQKSQLSWAQIEEVFSHVRQELRLHCIPEEQALPLSLQFTAKIPAFAKEPQAATQGRLALYWLERLKRLRLGFFLPAHLEFENESLDLQAETYEKVITDEDIRNLFRELLQARQHLPPEAKLTAIEINVLRNALGLRTVNEVFSLIARAQKRGVIRLQHSIPVAHQQAELYQYYAERNRITHPAIEAVFQLANHFLNLLGNQEEVVLGAEDLRPEVDRCFAEHFMPENFAWVKGNDNDDTAKKIQKEIKKYEKKNRQAVPTWVGVTFYLLRACPGIRHEAKMEDREVVQILHRTSSKANDASRFLQDLKTDCYFLFQKIAKGITSSPSNYALNVVETLTELKHDRLEYLDSVRAVISKLYLAKFLGSSLPMAVEVYQESDADLDERNPQSSDSLVFQAFQESQQLRRLRLLVLQAFSELPVERQNAFINTYFQCQSATDVVNLLENYLPQNSKLLAQFRDEALSEAEKKLNTEQKIVYEAPERQNQHVVAGPGSGKTHTLTLRVARLIHRDFIRPNEILILAYNRSVVTELKERLRRLFTALGYGSLVNSLQIFTIFGFMRYCLRERLDGIDFSEHADTFMNVWHNNPGLITLRVGNIRHILVDEFQDITCRRLDLLEAIGKNCIMTVIGDPNQSIYGYDRQNEQLCNISPKPLYDRFNTFFKPEIRYLYRNYRSYAPILAASEAFLQKNTETFDMQPLHAEEGTPDNWAAVETFDAGTENGVPNWIGKLKQCLETLLPTGMVPGQVAVLFRTNDELYRAFRLLKQHLSHEVRLRIQGENTSFLKIREVAFVVDNFIRPHLDESTHRKLPELFQKFRTQNPPPPAWDSWLWDVLESCCFEFQKELATESTFRDFLDYLRDVAEKDDGQLGKIYHQNGVLLSNYRAITEVILTTSHRVKGLEFDVVLLPPSDTDLPFMVDDAVIMDKNQLREYIEEERRLRYVSMTRAKYRLLMFNWQREKALTEGEHWRLPKEQRQTMGKPVKPGLDKFYIDFVAIRMPGVFDFIWQEVRKGEEVEIRRSVHGNYIFWQVWCRDRQVGQLSADGIGAILGAEQHNINRITGFSVTDVLVRYYAETLAAYERNGGINFAAQWNVAIQERGFTVIVEFAGYGKLN